MTTTRIAVITGAGAGIGKAAALALARDGFSLVLAGRRAEPLKAIEQDVRALGAAAVAVPTDVTDARSVQALFVAAKNEFGRVDVLFNNAGINAPGVALEDMTLDEWEMVLKTNLTGTFLCTQQAFKLMKAQTPRGGRIINNGSVSAHAPRPHSAPYTATKHAITGLTKSTALDGRTYDIACGQIDIGNAETEMSERIAKGVLQADGTIAAEPRMDSEHVGQAVAYMAGLPLTANVLFMTVIATKMPFVGRG